MTFLDMAAVNPQVSEPEFLYDFSASPRNKYGTLWKNH